MNSELKALCLSGSLALSSFMTKPVMADEWNKRTEFQFSAPVEIPGESDCGLSGSLDVATGRGGERCGSASIPSFEICSGDSDTGLAHCLGRLTAHCCHQHKAVVGPNSAERKSVHYVAL
jgi:hypothetical protein